MLGSRMISIMHIHKALLCSYACAIIGICFKIAFGLSFECILIGRFLNGLGTGTLYFLYGKALNETIPNHLLPTYSTITSIMKVTGYMATGWVSHVLPSYDSPKEEILVDMSWKIVYGWTIILQIIGILFTLVYLQNPSLNSLIKKDNK